MLVSALFLGCVDLSAPSALNNPDALSDGGPPPDSGSQSFDVLEKPLRDTMVSPDAAGTPDQRQDSSQQPVDSPPSMDSPPLDTGPSTCFNAAECVAGFACSKGICSSLATGLVAHWKLDDG